MDYSDSAYGIITIIMTRHSKGFTIIETSLVLGISGLLVVMVLWGIGTSLKRQRYTDSVNQVTDFFKGQYEALSSIRNDRPQNFSCSTGGITDVGAGETVGASACSIVGHILRSSDGKNIDIYQAIAQADLSGSSSLSNDPAIDILRQSDIVQSKDKIGTYNVEWASELLDPATSKSAQFSMLIARVPILGTVGMYYRDGSDSTVAQLLADPNNNHDVKFCVDIGGFYQTGTQPMGLRIAADAINSTGVEPLQPGECS